VETRWKSRNWNCFCHIPGKVVTVEVNVGDDVAEGQVILILEAMKMQNEIQAAVAGKVTEIHCEEGQSIEANVPLVIIKPDEENEE
jgi:Acetyl/propionyl-CoA carboxylase, alpha subunit